MPVTSLGLDLVVFKPKTKTGYLGVAVSSGCHKYKLAAKTMSRFNFSIAAEGEDKDPQLSNSPNCYQPI